MAHVGFKVSDELKEWIEEFAWRNRTTVSEIIRQHIIDLKNEEEGK